MNAWIILLGFVGIAIVVCFVVYRMMLPFLGDQFTKVVKAIRAPKDMVSAEDVKNVDEIIDLFILNALRRYMTFNAISDYDHFYTPKEQEAMYRYIKRSLELDMSGTVKQTISMVYKERDEGDDNVIALKIKVFIVTLVNRSNKYIFPNGTI